MQEQTNQQWKIIFGAVLVVAVLVALVLLLPGVRRNLTSTNLPHSYTLPGSFSASAPYGEGTVLLTNQRAFVSYNYRTGKVNNITSDSLDANFQDVDTILTTDDKRFVVFHSSLADPSGVLGDILQADGSDVYASYWWSYDTRTKTYHHFDKSVSKVHIDHNKVYALTNSGGPYAIDTYDLSRFTRTASMSITKSDDFFPVSGGFVLNAAGDKTVFTKDGIVNNEIFNGANVVGVLGDGQHIAGMLDNAQLGIFDLKSGKQEVVASNVGKVVVGQNTVLFNTTNKPNDKQPFYKLSVYTLTSGKVSSLNLPKSFSKVSQQPSLVLQDTTYITSGSGAVYLLSSDAAAIKNVPSNYSKDITVGANTVNLHYYNDQKAFLVTLDADNAQDEATAVYQQLRRDGYQPSLFTIRFSKFTPPPVNDADSPASTQPDDSPTEIPD
jgi:hypothetical protein